MNRERAAVVVGSVFGADFGNALYAGLRLPEFQRELRHALQDQGASTSLINDVPAHYETHFLKTFPALLDETGSFTSSTLASRLSKTFDLMGGAMAVDAGEASGLAALDASIGLLRSAQSIMSCAPLVIVHWIALRWNACRSAGDWLIVRPI